MATDQNFSCLSLKHASVFHPPHTFYAKRRFRVQEPPLTLLLLLHFFCGVHLVCMNSALHVSALSSSCWTASWTWWRRRGARWRCCGGARRPTARSSTTGSDGTATPRSWRREPPVGSLGSRVPQRRKTQHQVETARPWNTARKSYMYASPQNLRGLQT